MKIIVSVQAKQGSSRGLVHYIAHSKIDEQKEPGSRELFGSNSESMSVKNANEYLKSGVSKKRPGNEELQHLVISLKPENFKKLGETENERIKSLKEITRFALKSLEKSVNAESLGWAAGIHRNTPNPHVHIAIQKQFFDRDLRKRTLRKIPRECLPHYEKDLGEKKFKEGLLISSATQKFEEIAALQKRLPQAGRENLTKDQRGSFEGHTERNQRLDRARDILARAMLAEHFLERAREKRDSLLSDGDKRRFPILDKVTGKKRRMSLFDLERRALKGADREIRKRKIFDPEKRVIFGEKFVSAELSKNSESIKRIKTTLGKLIEKETKEVNRREKDFASLKPKAEKIRREYRKQNKKLPTPDLQRNELDILQIRGIEKGDVRTTNYLERVRHELFLEKKGPTRTKEQIQGLKARQIISRLRAKNLVRQTKNLADNKKNFSVEIGGRKWSLKEADSILEKRGSQGKRIVGKVRDLLGKTGLIQSETPSKEIEEIRKSISGKLDEKALNLEKQLQREKKISKTLDKFIKTELVGENHDLEAKFDASQLAEIEALAFNLKEVSLYKQNFEDQKRFIKGTDSHPGQAKEIIAGRAIAREVLSGIETSRSMEELLFFKRNKNFQKFEVKDQKTGDSKFVSLQQVRFDDRGSIFDQTLEYLTESREKRKTRNSIEKQIKQRGTEIKQNLKTAKEIHRVASEETKHFKQRSFFGNVKYNYSPIFTPKELIEIELRIEQTESRSEARMLQNFLNSADQSRSKNLAVILNSVSAEKEHAQGMRNSAGQQKSQQNSGTVVENIKLPEQTVQVLIGSEKTRPEQNLKIKAENQTKGR